MQIEFHQAIWFFWLIPLLVLFFLLFEKRRRHILFGIYPRQLLVKRLPSYSSVSHLVRFCLFILALICFGMALLKPYTDYEIREVKRKGVDIYLLVDLSESMLSQDIKPSRLERAKREIRDFLHMLKGDRVGLIGFAGDSYVFVPLTSDDNALGLFVDELSTDAIPIPGTDIKGAIDKAVDAFKKQTQTTSKSIILITDGEDSVGLNDAVLEDIKTLGVKLYVIGIGTTEGAPIPLEAGGYKLDEDGKVVLSKLNETAMQNLALSTGGGYVRSVSGDLDLEQIYFHGIKKSLKDEDLGTHQKKLPVYVFQIFILFGFIFLVMEILTTGKKGFWRSFLKMRSRKQNVLSILIMLFFIFSSPEAKAMNPFAFESANQDHEKSDFGVALQKYQKLLKNDSENPDLNYNLGNTYFKMKHFEEAQNAYKKALNSKDATVREKALYNLGNTFFRQKDLQSAIEYYDKVLQIDPKDKKAQLNKEYVQKLLEQKQQDQQQQNQQQQDQQQQDQQQQDQQQQDQQQQDQQKQDQQKDQQQDQQKDQKLEFDDSPDKWLNSLKDDPSGALKFMIKQGMQHHPKHFEKSW